MARADKSLQLSEVWGETVALRNLVLALLISCPTTLVVFLVARWLLESNMDDRSRADTYSLLVGLFTVIVCAVICARLFPPQRVVTTEAAGQSSAFDETLREIAEDEGGLGRVADLPTEVQDEMRELDLYDAFARAEAAEYTRPTSPRKESPDA
ncbi:hypothetical protein [Prescottella sp. R16]|uniref:hypothetical protein n=1 Tax=Prescottella sp. R16 TaxID=3064529 RepID=UPI00272EBF3B|nr:hypothetical protein [Prescottella sp. R16]